MVDQEGRARRHRGAGSSALPVPTVTAGLHRLGDAARIFSGTDGDMAGFDAVVPVDQVDRAGPRRMKTGLYRKTMHPMGRGPVRDKATTVAALAVAAALTSTLVVGVSQPVAGAAAIDLPAEGAFTCDFELPAGIFEQEVGGAIERDRIYMTRQPGMLFKYVPLRPDPATGTIRSGGRYLFDTSDHARAYEQFVKRSFVLDDTQFLDRDVFLNPDCRAWQAIGARDIGGFRAAVAVRMETWHVPDSNQRPLLQSRWPALARAAEEAGRNSVWLLYDKWEHVAAIVSTVPRLGPEAPARTEAGNLLALEAAPSLGGVVADQGWTRRTDRTHWVLTTWLPYGTGPNGEPDRGEPSLWPNSPLLPEPHDRDGVCVPSRGENHGTAPDDCTVNCGDGQWDDGEDNRRCPSDVPAF